MALICLIVVLVGCSGGTTPPINEDTDPPWWNPTGIYQATSGNGQVTIQFGEAIDNQSPPVRYLLYMDTDDNPFDQTPVIVSTHDPYTFSGLTNGTEYWFGVRASDSAVPQNIEKNMVTMKQTPWDPGVDIFPPQWQTTIGVANLVPGSGYIDVSWSYAYESQNPPVSYLVYMDTDDNPFDQTPLTFDHTVLSHRFEGLVNGQEYWFGVRCSDSAIPPNIDTNTEVKSITPFEQSWLITFGGPRWDTMYDLAVDADNNIYLSGNFFGSVDFDPGPGSVVKTSTGTENPDAFIAKYDTDGNLIHVSAWGNEGYEVPIAFTLDEPRGRMIIAGYFSGDFGALDMDPSDAVDEKPSYGGADCFMSILDLDGNYLQSITWGGVSDDRCTCVTTDESGNIYVAGNFTGTVDFDPGSLVDSKTFASGSPEYYYDVFIVKYDPTGNYQWVKTFGNTGHDEAKGIVADDGIIFLFGSINVYGPDIAVDLDPGAGEDTFTSSGVGDAFLSLLNYDGEYQRASTFDMLAKDITGDKSGGCYVLSDASLREYNAAGDNTWLYDFTSYAYTLSVTTDLTGNPIISDNNLVKVQVGGDQLWERNYGEDISFAVVDNDNNIIVGGHYTYDFRWAGAVNNTREGSIIPDPNWTDVFIMKLDQDGLLK